MKELFDIGEWVSTEDGLGQVIYNRPIHVEKFNKQKGKDKVGTHLRNLYICKVLCDFEGKPKRSFKTNIYSSIDRLNPNDLELIEQVKKISPDLYEKYLLSENKTLLQHQCFVSFGLFNIEKDLLQAKFVNIKDKLANEFTFKEFEKVFNNENMSFDILEYIQYGYTKPQGSTELKIRFDADLYKVRDKEFVFKNFRVFLNTENLEEII
jgi:hypothetical protein